MTRLGPVPRPLLVLAIIAAGLLLAYQVIVVGGASQLQRAGRADLAVEVWPDYAAAASQRAEELASAGRARQAQAWAIRALRTSAQDSRALRAIADSARASTPDMADHAMMLAAKLGWRDGFAQLWVLERALETNDVIPASQAADALLRVDFQRGRAIAGVRRLVSTGPGRDALAERMSASPYWADWFFTYFRGASPQENEDFAQLLLQLNQRGALPSDAQVRRYFATMLATGEQERAIRVWRQLNPRTAGDPTRGILDGGFSQFATGSAPWGPFSWRTRDNAGIDITTESRTQFSQEPTLKVAVDETSPVRPIFQTLVLRPGNYTFRFDSMVQRGSDRLFQWELRCSEARRPLLRGPAPAASAGRWTTQSHDFAIPARDCQSQTLALLVGGGRREMGVGMFDNLEIEAR